MQSASPQHTGTVQKLHVSPLFTILPHLVQKLILTLWCFKFLRPRWETRYLILLGSYLYKFSLTGTDDGNNNNRLPHNSNNKNPKELHFRSSRSTPISLTATAISVSPCTRCLPDTIP